MFTVQTTSVCPCPASTPPQQPGPLPHGLSSLHARLVAFGAYSVFLFFDLSPTPPAPPAETMVAPAQLVSWPLLLPLHLSSLNSQQSCPHTDLTISVFSNPPVASCVPQSKVQMRLLLFRPSGSPCLLTGLPSRPHQSACPKAFALAVPSA